MENKYVWIVVYEWYESYEIHSVYFNKCDVIDFFKISGNHIDDRFEKCIMCGDYIATKHKVV